MLKVLKWLTANNKYFLNIFFPECAQCSARWWWYFNLLCLNSVFFQLWISSKKNCVSLCSDESTRTVGHLSLLALSDAWLKEKLCDNLRYGCTLASMWLYITREFNTEDYMSCAFPKLLPTWAADYLAPRQIKITAWKQFQAPDDVSWLMVFPTPMIQIFCSGQWNALVWTTERLNINSRTPGSCMAKRRGSERHDWMWGKGLFILQPL